MTVGSVARRMFFSSRLWNTEAIRGRSFGAAVSFSTIEAIIDEINFEADIPGYIDNSMLVEAIVAQQILPKGALLNGRITMDAENYYILSYDFLELENIVQALRHL